MSQVFFFLNVPVFVLRTYVPPLHVSLYSFEFVVKLAALCINVPRSPYST